MRYRKRVDTPAAARRTLVYRGFTLNMDVDESALSEKYTPLLYNMREEGGVLVSAGGIAPLVPAALWENPEGETGGIMYYRRYDHEDNMPDDKLVVYAGSGKPLFYMDLYGEDRTVQKLEYAPFNEPPNFLNYRLDGEDVLIMSSPADSMAVWNGGDGLETVTDAPRINSMCMHYERLFATDAGEGTALWFSDDLDPRNWSVSLDEAGFIELVGAKGKLLAVISFSDYVYVFRTYGISRLTAYGDQTQFAVHELFTATGRIEQRSIALCGDRILFVAADGLYSFDGLTAKRLPLGVDTMLARADTAHLSAAYAEGKYLASFRYDFDDGQAVGAESGDYCNNVLLEYDVNSGKAAVVRGVDVASMALLSMEQDTTLAVLYREGGRLKIGKYLPRADNSCVPLAGYYAAPRTNFGEPDKKKLLKNLQLFTDTDAVVTVWTDGAERVYRVAGKSETQILQLALPCVRGGFSVSVRGGNCRVKDVKLTAEVIG